MNPRTRVVLLGLLLLVCLPCEATGESSRPWLQYPDDPFIRLTGPGPGWVKFMILLDDPEVVIFQDSNLYPFHYDFATLELPYFQGITATEFDNVTLFAAGQEAVLGAVFIPDGGQPPELGIQLVRRDAYEPGEAIALLQTVRESILPGSGVDPLYMPAYEQSDSASAHADQFAAAGFPVAPLERWEGHNDGRGDGWAIGTLRSLAPGEIEGAFASGELEPRDLVLTDALPATIPPVAGLISLGPTTPASRVALLARTFEIPLAGLTLDPEIQKAQSLVGRQVFYRVRGDELRIVDASEELDAVTVDDLLAHKAPVPSSFPAVQSASTYSLPAGTLKPAFAGWFGTESSYYGVLRQSLPENCPPAAAFSFDLWSDFRDQELAGGMTLEETIAGQLAAFSYPPDILALDAALESVRQMIVDPEVTFFSTVLQTAVLSTLQDAQYGFTPGDRLRFRSSTNLDDGEGLSADGLHDDVAGCLADDLDGDEDGPSLCDPAALEEQGAFTAIRQLFAGFYDLDAYMHRLRHGIDESDAAIAPLVSHPVAAGSRMAGGLAVYEQIDQGEDARVELVLQPGSASVAQPESGQTPEEVSVTVEPFNGGSEPTLERESNLVVLGSTVLGFPDEYEALSELLRDSVDYFRFVTGESRFTLEIEFTKTAPDGKILVTRMGRVPLAVETASTEPFLLDEPTAYCLRQGDASSTLAAAHRLKSDWNIRTASVWLTPANLESGFIEEADLEIATGCRTIGQAGPIAAWPEFDQEYTDGRTVSRWSMAEVQNPRQLALTLRVTETPPEILVPGRDPVVLLSDLGSPAGCLSLRATYSEPVPELEPGLPDSTLSDEAVLCTCPQPEIGDLLTREIVTDGGITIDTTYYRPRAEGSATPEPWLARFVETTITGLTPEPIVLHGEFSQTLGAGAPGAGPRFLFDPRLDPGVAPDTWRRLDLLDVRVLEVEVGTITTYGPGEWWDYSCPRTFPDWPPRDDLPRRGRGTTRSSSDTSERGASSTSRPRGGRGSSDRVR